MATAHPIATEVGAGILAAGGNAMDAAIAGAAATNVVLPAHCGIGGDAFALYYDVESDAVFGLNASGVAPAGARREVFTGSGETVMPDSGARSVAVPGQVSALIGAAERFGSLPIEDLLEPAIRLAADGVRVNAELARCLEQKREMLLGDECAAAVFCPDNRPLAEGATLYQQDLADTLGRIGEGGLEYFYRGEFARAFLSHMEELGGLFDGNEMAGQVAEVYVPPSVTYRGHRVFSQRPVSQGVIFLECLAILDGILPTTGSPDDPDWIHRMVEIKKLAFADRNAHVADPSFDDFDYEVLLSAAHIARRRKDLGEWASDEPWCPGTPSEDTTYLCAVDQWGNACSFIHSLSHLFGSGVMVPGTGVLLNNRAGRGFSLHPDHPNVIAPGKRTMHTLNCYLLRDADGCITVGGTPGGDGQPQWNMQVLSHIIDFGLTPQAAVDYPRWTSFPGTDPASLYRETVLRMEDRFPGHTRESLEERGHVLAIGDSWESGGAALVIRARPGGVQWEWGVDRRSGGCAIYVPR